MALHKFCYEICAPWFNIPAQPTPTNQVERCWAQSLAFGSFRFSLEKSSQPTEDRWWCCCWGIFRLLLLLRLGKWWKVGWWRGVEKPGKWHDNKNLRLLLWIYEVFVLERASAVLPPLDASCTRYNLTLMSVKVDSLILANGIIGHGQPEGAVNGRFPPPPKKLPRSHTRPHEKYKCLRNVTIKVKSFNLFKAHFSTTINPNHCGLYSMDIFSDLLSSSWHDTWPHSISN